MDVCRWFSTLLAVALSCASALAQDAAAEPKVYSKWETTGVTNLDRSIPKAFAPAPLPVLWVAPRLSVGHFPFSWVDAGLGVTLRLSDYVRLEGSFDYALTTVPERAPNQRFQADGTLGVRVWGRSVRTRFRYALGATRPQSQYSATKLSYVELELPSREALYVEGGLMSATLGFRRCPSPPCTTDELTELSGAWVHHVRAGARFSRFTWASLDNSDGVRSLIEVAAYALMNVGALPNEAIFDVPSFRPRTNAQKPAPLGGEVHVRWTPWYYQWVAVELMLGYLPGPRSAEFRLGFSLPLWLHPWELSRQFDVRTGGT